jgi:peptidoglycan/LPS O-acetylase OafA/YrhL
VLARLGTLHTDTPLGFIPDLPILVYMGAFFGWGWLVHARPDELERYARRAWYAAALALGCLAAVVVTLARGLSVVEAPPLHAIAASAGFSIAVMVWFLGACVRYLAQPHPLLRLASESSYWFYIVHLPLVVALQIAVSQLAVPGPLKYVAIVTVTTAACLGTYALVSRVAGGRRRKASRTSSAHR